MHENNFIADQKNQMLEQMHQIVLPIEMGRLHRNEYVVNRWYYN